MMSSESIKLTVVGDAGVGKTSLLISYCTNTFPREHTRTVFENYAGKKMLNVYPRD